MSPQAARSRASKPRSLQDMYAPRSVCFGCGPMNRKGLHLKSRPEGDEVVADWTASRHHVAFSDFASGGIISVLLDCNGNWAATYFLMKRRRLVHLPGTVTAEYTVTFLRPTPIGEPWRLSARAVKLEGNRVYVKGKLEAGGATTATMKGLFVAVGPDHPAYHRWK